MKIIFLDIDGVINLAGPGVYGRGFHAPSLAQLKRVVDSTGAYIVLSSSWRYDSPESARRVMLAECLRELGLPDRVIGTTATESIGYDKLTGNEFGGFFGKIRGFAINEWLKENSGTYESFVILDDIRDMGRLNGNLAVCDGSEGITAEVSERAVEILNNRIQREG